jgi:hypothetical protein
MAGETVEDVLREMDEFATVASRVDSGQMVSRWLDVLRPALSVAFSFGQRPPAYDSETFSLRSGLPQSELRDLNVMVTLSVDHEGGGRIEIGYPLAPPENRLQALLSIMGALGDRIALAMGEEAYRDLLRGVLARRERHG